MIDKNAKLFGKLNVLDFLIILVLVAGAAFTVWQFQRGEGVIAGIVGGTETATHTVSFYSPINFPDTAEGIYVGGLVSQQGSMLSFGEIVAVNTWPTIEHRPNAEGVLVGSEWGERVGIEITTEVNLPVGAINHGLHIEGTRFAMGQTVTIHAGNSILHLRISGFHLGSAHE